MTAELKDKFITFLIVVALSLAPLLAGAPQKVSAASCAYSGPNYGTVTSTINITELGPYRVWSRIQTGTAATDNSYLIKITDGATTTCYNVGDNNAIPTGSWQWIDYQDGNTNSKINHTFLSGGSKTIEMIGNSDGVLLDRVIFAGDLNCVPNNTIDNPSEPDPLKRTVGNVGCPPGAPNVAPTVSLAASPTSGTAPLSTTLTATPSDSDGTITKVEFFQGGTSIGIVNAPGPWTKTITGLAAGTYSYTAKATDNSGTVSNASTAVTVTSNAALKKGDCTGVTAGVPDGVVDGNDLIRVMGFWRQSNKTRAECDLTGPNGTPDGYIDGNDFIEVITNWRR